MRTNLTPENREFYLGRLMTLACKRLNSSQIQCILSSNLSNKVEKAFEEGLVVSQNLRIREREASSYQPSFEEKESMRRLILHRKILHSYSSLIDLCRAEASTEETVEFLIDIIQKNIDDLTNRTAANVLFNEHGRSMFCMPGGTLEHSICYEFAREADGSYSFLIYNKGEGTNYAPFHGNVKINKGGLVAGRTRVQIRKLSLECIKDRDFLEALIFKQIEFGSTTYEVYALIKEYLIDRGGGSVLVSPEERELSEGNHQEASYRASLKKELLKNPDYHRFQTWGTCSESSFQTPERFLIDPTLRKKLKSRGIAYAIEMLGEQVLTQNPMLAIQTKAKMQSLREQIYKAESQKSRPSFVCP